MRLDPWWRPLLLIGGATPSNSYVELSEDAVNFRFGWLFRRTLPRSDIEEAVPRRWPLWYGVGWRTNFRGLIGLIGSYQGVVEIHLRTPGRVWGLFSLRRLAVSLEEPQRFLDFLGAA